MAAAAALWGLWPVWVRGAAGGAATAAIAQTLAGLVTLPFAARHLVGLSRRAWTGLVLLGVCNAANCWMYFRAIAEGAVAPAVLAHYFAPVFVALSAPLVLKEPRGRRTPVALLLALGGAAVLLFVGGETGGPGTGRAVALGAGSAVFYAGATLSARWVVDEVKTTALFAAQALLGGLVLLPFVTLPPLGEAWVRPALGAFLSCMAPGMCFYAGLARLPAERAGVLAYLEVPAAVLVGWIVFAEAPAGAALLGGLGILAAGLLVATEKAG